MKSNTTETATLGRITQEATLELRHAAIPSARLDCLLLLELATGQDRAYILAHPEYALNSNQIDRFDTLLAQRLKHNPLAYIRGYAEFYGRRFIVDKHVLVPRPETEAMIELLKQISVSSEVHTIADIGTGSGCIGITAALEVPGSMVYLSDIDRAALDIAKRNAKLHSASVSLVKSDLLDFKHQPLEIIMTNLPYVPLDYDINKDATFEPELALFAGEDGLAIYKRFWQQIKRLSYKPPCILAESLLEQHSRMAILAHKAGYHVEQTKGLVQQFTADKTN